MVTLSKPLAILILFLTTLFWGTTFPFTKELTRVLHPVWIITLRFGCAAIILLLLAYPNIRKAAKTISKRDYGLFLLLGILNLGGILFLTMSLKISEVANSSFLLSIALLIIPFWELLLFGIPLRRKIIVALTMMLCGIYLMSYGFELPRRLVAGDLLALLAALIYSFYIILVGLLSKRYHAGVIMFIAFSITALLCLPLGLAIPQATTPDFSALGMQTVFNLGFLVVIGTVTPYVLMGVGQRTVDAQTSAMIYILEPVFATLIALFFFAQPISFTKYIGAGIILIAQWIAIRRS
ncbi:DMT family transporter [Thermodesulfobacteriota bacterium]